MMKKLLKITEIATTQIEDLNEDCVKISRPYLFILPEK